MEISDDTRRLLEKRVSKIVNNIDVHENDKKEIQKELLSHFYDASAGRAESRGSNRIEREDVEAVFAESEDPDEVASEYMKSYVDAFKRAGFGSRTVAYIIDVIIYGICLAALIIPIVMMSWFVRGYSPALETFFNYVQGIGALTFSIVYFMVIEGSFGTTPGKYFMNLRVLREDGTKIGYKESILRNIPKIINGLLVIDAILLLVLFGKEKQRGFDKVAGTIVIHTNKKQ
ncbi:hypothetical protein CUJ83_06665 [Methanocella sp. CWC-04]|uniref:RDD domain-containing protein n=1 Tax=Methanooceanicella nereidis TaxID=2052831 RepID=A0AAP2RD36_9EURY|nr:RDD family protein [Methanocella sp. CWC-04]MCD1294681.1 hypothetical protein [Methanocella sp. CWC-04]